MFAIEGLVADMLVAKMQAVEGLTISHRSRVAIAGQTRSINEVGPASVQPLTGPIHNKPFEEVRYGCKPF